MALFNLIIIAIFAIILSRLMKKLNLPGLVGMLIAGIVTGPYAFDLISDRVIGISANLRLFALIIILARAGLALDIKALMKIGRPAILMSVIPPVLEIGAVVILAPVLFSITHLEAAIMGAVLSAVSPAVVVPRMLKMMKNGRGISKGIPQLVMAATSVNGIFAIVLFALFTSAEGSGGGLDMILRSAVLPLATVVAGAATLRFRPDVAAKLSGITAKIWVPSEVMLFVLVGASINLNYVSGVGAAAIAMIAIALAIRMCGVWLCLAKTYLSMKERLFCAISYSPKATVQAAIGGTALAVGVDAGHIILTVAALAILITAPLGALGIDLMCRRMGEQ